MSIIGSIGQYFQSQYQVISYPPGFSDQKVQAHKRRYGPTIPWTRQMIAGWVTRSYTTLLSRCRMVRELAREGPGVVSTSRSSLARMRAISASLTAANGPR